MRLRVVKPGEAWQREVMFQKFIDSEAAGGIVLIASAVLALVVANSPLAGGYFAVLATYVGGLNVLHWINDALMALFFLLVGLEIKRELLSGQLASWKARALPGVAALGGMVVPALIYVGINGGSPETLRGWAIPTATDIAFALGVMALLGSRVPASLKLFLTALAIIDDLGAVAIIALFYTSQLSALMLALAAAALGALLLMNRLGVRSVAPYLAVGALLWFFVLKSGVHPTISGVLLAFTVPIDRGGEGHSPLHKLESALASVVGFAILPVFAFANAGVALGGLGFAEVANPVTLGVGLGLFVGKQLGVFGGAWLAIRWSLAERPQGANWPQVYGVSLLCGIGFTMSLFIGLLAFPSDVFADPTKIGVLGGSLLSAVAGWYILRTSSEMERKA
jgi:Na+:H+ antiporter, NhaA family